MGTACMNGDRGGQGVWVCRRLAGTAAPAHAQRWQATAAAPHTCCSVTGRPALPQMMMTLGLRLHCGEAGKDAVGGPFRACAKPRLQV